MELVNLLLIALLALLLRKLGCAFCGCGAIITMSQRRSPSPFCPGAPARRLTGTWTRPDAVRRSDHVFLEKK